VPREAGVALALRTVAGFGVGEIARAFLVGEAAVAQRLVRAKRRLREADVRLAVPESAADLAARLPAVLDTLYLVFNEGYSASRATAPIRRDLCTEALRLARLWRGTRRPPGRRRTRSRRSSASRARGSTPGGRGRRPGPARRPGPRALGPRARRPGVSGTSRAPPPVTP
jgi:hypothetical protein